MKLKIILLYVIGLFILMGWVKDLSAQNIQLHYDFGKADNFEELINRRYFTSTLEVFKPDKTGSTFLFVDIDFDKPNGGASLAYFEVVRKFTLNRKSGLSAHIELNDGSPSYIRQAWLAGLAYPVRLGKVILHTSLLYRANQGASRPDGQLTIVWFHSFLNDRIVFNGFFDFWTQDKFIGSGKDGVLLSEPQLWFLLTENFALGSEIEISRNFFSFDGDVEAMPTIGLKWTF